MRNQPVSPMAAGPCTWLLAAILAIAFSAAACNNENGVDDAAASENGAAECADQLDNDSDGAIDCDDVECATICAANGDTDSSTDSDTNAPSGPTFHVFLLLGQSNMEGWPKALDEDRGEDERVQVLGFDNCTRTGRKTDEWDVAAPPLHSCWNDGLGPGDYFAKTLVEVIPEGDTIGLVPCAKNGEAIETFMKDGGQYWQWIVDRAKLAQDAGGVIEGFIFHQGESNNMQSDWPSKVQAFIADLKSELGLGDIPFLPGELAQDGSCSGHNPLVHQLEGLIPNTHVVVSDGLHVDPSDEWNVHFDHASQVTFGQRYAQTMIDALGW
ncbi:MAG: sialate O-acetylesterase [Deltaproteobacteria bacterium]|nr:sialate O-acetylesterase [Deltaproteobacteria bacterium]MBN2673388.1 sialate O-acetylesterase [Deltaproteobacteria bacterium]